MINILCCQSITVNDYVDRTIKIGEAKVEFNSKICTVWDTLIFKLRGPRIINAILGIEFNVLYRWHALVPNEIYISGDIDNIQLNKDHCRPILSFEKGMTEEWNSVNLLTSKNGMERVIKSGSIQIAGELTLKNTNSWISNVIARGGIEKTENGNYNL